MKLSVMTTLADASYCQRAGFDGLDLGLNFEARPEGPLTKDDWRDYAAQQAQLMQEKQVSAVCSHAYFSKALYNRMDSDVFKEEYVLFERVMHMAGIMGLPRITVHPLRIEEYDMDGMIAENVVFFHRIADIARQYNMHIAIENMVHPQFGNPYNVLRLLDELKDEDMFGMCIDTGHANVNGVNVPQLIRDAGSRLVHTHVHDNRAVKDAHSLPFWGTLEWQPIMEALAEIKYQGAFNLEISVRRIPEPIRASMLSYAEATGRYLLTMAE